MPTWITVFDKHTEFHSERQAAGGGLRVAVKDAIDVAGVATTAGCAAVAREAGPAAADAHCLAGFRSAGADLIGKTNLDELCLGTSGVNEWFGTPVNPGAPDRIPGGSSSGSAVAVAGGEADIGLGTDTGGSIRIPAACCGIVGLKTTWGRISRQGVWGLSPSMDTIGPLAADMAGVVRAMEMLDLGWAGAIGVARVIGRLRIGGTDIRVENAVDLALEAAGLEVRPVSIEGWTETFSSFRDLLLAEFHQQHSDLLGVRGVGDFANRGLLDGSKITKDELAAAETSRRAWAARLDVVFGDVEVLALPTLISLPPRLHAAKGFPLTALTAPFSLAGLPALALPLSPSPEGLPPSLQLVGPPGSDERLCATGMAIETAIATT